MPQDTVLLPGGNGYYILPEGYDTLPAASRKIFDSVIEDAKWNTHSFTQQIGNTDKGSDAPMYIFLLVLIVGIILRFRQNMRTGNIDNASAFDDDDNESETTSERKYLTYYGANLDFTGEVLTGILVKHFPYFNILTETEKEKFLHRLQKFIAAKTYNIHDESGFREMPVVISAAAIQLSFGLEKYLLPNFEYINIFPEEFIGVHPTIRVLEGNVSGHSINLSWKHVLNGFRHPGDGQNVGLHEMAHAYYFQFFEAGENADDDFVSDFPKFNVSGNKIFEEEQKPGNDFYSDYALKNFQEFWAESIELFFERSVDMQERFPDLYSAIKDVLNQDPASRQLSSS